MVPGFVHDIASELSCRRNMLMKVWEVDVIPKRLELRIPFRVREIQVTHKKGRRVMLSRLTQTGATLLVPVKQICLQGIKINRDVEFSRRKHRL